MGRTGQAAYQALHQREKRVVGLDADPTVLESLLAEGRRVIYGDSEDPELWAGLRLDRVKGIILTLPEFDARCSAVRQIRKNGYKGQIGTLCYLLEEKEELRKLGADFTIHPLVEAGNQLARRILGGAPESDALGVLRMIKNADAPNFDIATPAPGAEASLLEREAAEKVPLQQE
jgi:glutathione-regulated potassium-efflux system ancillary protein KefC